jgi:integrase
MEDEAIRPEWRTRCGPRGVDRRCVINHAQARHLISAVREQPPNGPRLGAFFAVIYYTALRPEEAVNLRSNNITFPPLGRNEATGEWEEPADD